MQIFGDVVIIKDRLFFQASETGLNKLFMPIMLLENGKLVFAMALVEEDTHEDYDYNYEDNLEYIGLVTERKYHPIAYSPFDGSRFEFSIVNVIDKTAEYEDIKKMEEYWDKQRASSKKSKALCELSIQKQSLVENILIFEVNDENVYDENECIHWSEVIEN